MNGFSANNIMESTVVVPGLNCTPDEDENVTKLLLNHNES